MALLPPPVRREVAAASHVVAFTGAGVSAESGLATFRGSEGLWEEHRLEDLATPQGFARRPEVVWRWYVARYEQAAAAAPNPAHHALARLPSIFPVATLVSQNVDGLHRRAGSEDVLEVHGTLSRARCHRCGEETAMAEAVAASREAPPRCGCGGLYRPAVVWFGEPLPARTLAAAFAAAESCDLLLSVGTSAQVFPAAGVIEAAHRAGAAVIEVNPEPTGFSGLAGLRIERPAGEALPALVEEMAACRRPS